MFPPTDFLEFDHTAHRKLFAEGEPVWEPLKRIADYLEQKDGFVIEGDVSKGAHIDGRVRLGAGSRVEPGAVIRGPAWIGEHCTIRSGAYLRANVITGDHCTLGNSCEFKNCLLFDHCEVPHFNYVGDAILGFRAHLGAGAILSNVRLDREEIEVRHGSDSIPTGLRKFSAIVGDHTEIGCNAVVNPGSLLGRHCILYPNAHWSGVLPDRRIVKVRQNQEIAVRRGPE